MTPLASLLESILFVASKPIGLKKLAEATKTSEEEVLSAVSELREIREGSGLVILEAFGKYQLATNGENAKAVAEFLTSDLKEQLTDASLEVLAVIAYRGPVTRAEVDAVRGVNSQYSIRHLLMRGLIEKSGEGQGRSPRYQITTDLLGQLGISRVGDLPNFETVQTQISQLPKNLEPAAEDENSEADEPDSAESSVLEVQDVFKQPGFNEQTTILPAEIVILEESLDEAEADEDEDDEDDEEK